jgi:uncharacterized protein YdhG (YjbR/CyaY superfamily)
MRPTAPPSNVNEYLDRVPEPARETLENVRARILAVVPAEATEAISYGIPTVRYQGALVAYAAFKKHCSLFPMSLAVMRDLAPDLARYDTSKGTIRFPPGKPLPGSLVNKIVKARLAEKERRSK